MRIKIQTFFKIGAILIFVLIFTVYGLYKARGFLAGPKIKINEPENGQVFQNSLISVNGKAENVALIYLNGRQIFTDENGLFKESLLLAKGYGIITIEAKDKFGRIIKKTREVALKQNKK